MDGVGLLHPVEIPTFLGLGGELYLIVHIVFGKSTTDVSHGICVFHTLKQTSTHNIECLVFRNRLPNLLQTAKIAFQLSKYHLSSSFSGIMRIRQRGQ
jgi:hypothetical protein